MRVLVTVKMPDTGDPGMNHYDHQNPGPERASPRLPLAEAATAKDPVCGMDVPLDTARRKDFRATSYVFCGQRCLDRFERDPGAFVAVPVPEQPKSAPVPAVPTASTQWICPMHAQIVRDAPGSCPICGMALEHKMQPALNRLRTPS
jgi:Cu+-exporting ATPase